MTAIFAPERLEQLKRLFLCIRNLGLCPEIFRLFRGGFGLRKFVHNRLHSLKFLLANTEVLLKGFPKSQ